MDTSGLAQTPQQSMPRLNSGCDSSARSASASRSSVGSKVSVAATRASVAGVSDQSSDAIANFANEAHATL